MNFKINLNDKTKKILSIISKVFTWIVVAITVVIMGFTIFATTTFDKNNRSIFGIKFYIVKTDSMSKSDKNANDKIHFNAGDLIIVKNVKDKKSLKKGDVISFQSLNEESFGETITHMIYDCVYDIEGNLIGYKTYGTNTGTVDESVVQPEYVMGKYIGKLPNVGHFFRFLKTTPGYIVCILIPFMILIIYQGVNCVKIFRKYKKQQLEEINAEKAKIEEERRASADMLKQLEELKAQLAQKTAENSLVPQTANEQVPAKTVMVNENKVENSETQIAEESSNIALVEKPVNNELKQESVVNAEEKVESHDTSLQKVIDKAIKDFADSIEKKPKEDETNNNN